MSWARKVKRNQNLNSKKVKSTKTYCSKLHYHPQIKPLYKLELMVIL